jgi:hypothetical protein
LTLTSSLAFVCQYAIANIVCLEGAALLEVSGGSRKHDLKRAFALVENTGNTYIFIAGCDDEYITWVNAISNAISAHSVHGSKAPLDESFLIPKNDSTNADKGQLIRSIAKVVQATKSKGQDIARTVKMSGLSPDGDIVQGRTTSTVPGANIPEPLPSSGGSIGVTPRMNLLRNRIAGVSHVTKGRIGSTFSVAKKKGKEAIQRRLMSTSSTKSESIDSSSADGVEFYPDDATSENWKCSTCLSLNMLDREKCKTCECVRSNSQLNDEAGAISSITPFDQTGELDNVITGEENSRRTDGNECRLQVGDQSDLIDIIDEEEFKSQSGIKQRFSAVVQRAKIASSGRQMFGRQATPQDNDPGTGSANGQKVFNIELNGPLRVHKYPFGERRNQHQSSPMKKIDGTWIITVELNRKTPSEDGEFYPIQNNELDSTQIGQTEYVGFKNATNDESTPNSSNLNQFVDLRFTINVMNRTLADSSSGSKSTEFTRNLSEIGVLHTTVSDSISQLPPYQFEDSVEVGEYDSVEAPSKALYNRSYLDSLLISGRILGDLLDLLLRVGIENESVSNYAGKILSQARSFMYTN